MPILSAQSLEVISRTPEQTRRVGMRLGTLLKTGDVICLVGDLGSGKTTLVQGISSGWGSLDAVTSPTFVLVNVYRRPDHARLFHLDAYRLSGASEALDLDLDMFLQNGPLVVEWADRIFDALPDSYLKIHLNLVSETQRDMVMTAHGNHYLEMLSFLRKGIYGN
jgi:tRNA threonylcarbamoyladenosine biosynthesis protein TsaE